MLSVILYAIFIKFDVFLRFIAAIHSAEGDHLLGKSGRVIDKAGNKFKIFENLSKSIDFVIYFVNKFDSNYFCR